MDICWCDGQELYKNNEHDEVALALGRKLYFLSLLGSCTLMLHHEAKYAIISHLLFEWIVQLKKFFP